MRARALLVLAGTAAMTTLTVGLAGASATGSPAPRSGAPVAPSHPATLTATTVRTYDAFDADQGVAVDRKYFYSVDNFSITKHDRRTGAALLQWYGGDRGIDAADLAIAATADLLRARLLTRNVRRFPMFEGLAAPY